MILYNVTIGIDKDIEPEWVQWMKSKHIPDVLATGVFAGHRFYKVLSHDDEGSASYCVQYFAASIVEFNQFLQTAAPRLVEEHRERFKDRHVVFNTLLEEVE